MQTNHNLLDMDQINNLKEIFNHGFAEFIATFFRDFESKEKDLLTAIANRQGDNIIKIAHTLKGSSLNVGATGLAGICSRIEVAGKNGSYEEALQELKDLQHVLSQSKEAYMQLIPK